MKPPKSIEDLATRLTAAATAPLQVLGSAPERTAAVDDASHAPAAVRNSGAKADEPKTGKGKGALKVKAETLGINLRPTRTLYQRYVLLAADRSRSEGRMISAQQIMLEVLERARA